MASVQRLTSATIAQKQTQIDGKSMTIKLYLQRQTMSQRWPQGQSLITSTVDDYQRDFQKYMGPYY